MDFDAETIERLRRRLRSKVRYHVGTFCPDVDDLIQETLARFLRAVEDDNIHNPNNLGAFLSGICNHVIHEYRRRLWREVPSEMEAREPGAMPVEAEAIELREAITEALADLSDRDCHLLRSFYLDEKSKDEICAEAGLSDSQFRVALFRAKARFRKVYRSRVKYRAPGSH